MIVIPINRTVCVACAAELAELGERECSKCLFESRFAAWAETDCELPLGVAMPIEDALRWASGGTMPPRITEVPTASVPREVPAVPVPREVASRRVSQTWVGLLLLTACLRFGVDVCEVCMSEKEMRSARETPLEVTFDFKCSCGADGVLTLQKRDGYKSFGCPEGCGNTYVPYQAPLGWRLRCVVERVVRRVDEKGVVNGG